VSLLKDLLILPQMTITDIESSDYINYAIKKIIDSLYEEIIYITEGKQNQLGKDVTQNLM
ncbi:139_t:CDS:1, partial [Funneliformis caledonium]